MESSFKRGILYVVSTPIGNLEDISSRALRILSEVDLIAAEDTRKTRIILQRYKVRNPMVSYFSMNEERRVPMLIGKLMGGESVAVVSDAGTPGISDPAFRMIRAALDENINVVPIPGATAFLPALIASGLPSQRFIFEGFLPVKKGRRTLLEKLSSEERTIILYESPHRLLRTLRDLYEIFGDRAASASREITKKFEETVRGTLLGIIKHYEKNPLKGEFVLVIGGRRQKH